MKTFDLKALETRHPKAFEALPEPYRNDSVLQFWIQNCNLFCAPIEKERPIVGDWVFQFVDSEWRQIYPR